MADWIWFPSCHRIKPYQTQSVNFHPFPAAPFFIDFNGFIDEHSSSEESLGGRFTKSGFVLRVSNSIHYLHASPHEPPVNLEMEIHLLN